MDNEQIKRNLKQFFQNFFVFRIRDYDYETIEIEGLLKKIKKHLQMT